MSTTNERAKAAAEEIERKWKLTHHHYEGYVTPHDTELAEIIARHFADQDASDTLRTLATNACDLWADEKDHFSDKFYSAMKALNNRLDATPVEPVAGQASGQEYWKPPFSYESEGSAVWDANNERLLDVRGWGMLTGKGAFGLNVEEAAKIQDCLGNWIARTLTAAWPQRHAPTPASDVIAKAREALETIANDDHCSRWSYPAGHCPTCIAKAALDRLDAAKEKP